MSDIPAHILVGRGDAVDVLSQVLADIHNDERNRRWWARVKAVVPWTIAGGATLTTVAFGLLVYARPVPKDHFMLAVVHGNTYETPIERDDLPPSRKQVLRDYTLIQFIKAYEGYVFRANQANYQLISALTAGQPLQKQYQRRFLPGAPENVDDKYGGTDGSGTRDVVALQLVPVPNAPFVTDVQMLIRVRKSGSATCQRWTARMSFQEDDKHIVPLDIQKLYDPMDLIFVSYDSSPDPAAPTIGACPTA